RFRNHGYQALNMQRNINENTDLQAATPAIEINRLYDMMGVGTQALRVLALVIILVSALSVFIALFSSLKERRYELALMRVMGASRGTLFFLLLAEGVLLAGLGCLLGLLLSHGGMGLLAAYLEEAYRYPFSGWLFLPKEFQLIFASIAIGILAALLPAFQASRTDISDTLTAS
ncbi:MAG: FtsX-like permease family protein, partial [Bacteroidota bacterium]